MASGLDEVIFRATERVELLHLQVVAGANQAKDYILQLQQLILQAWNNPALKEALEKAADTIMLASTRALEGAQDAWRRVGIDDLPSPGEMIRRINIILSDQMWRHTAIVFVCGAACGTLFGVTVGWYWGSRNLCVPHYKALHSLPDGTAVVVEDGAVANIIHPGDVMIRINSFSVQPLDRDVLKGRAKRLRELIRPRNKEVTVGRSFSGVVTEMGSSVTRLDIGDEVWGGLAEWEGGGAQEMITAPARRVGRSPRALLPQAAASLPYCGSLALHNLHKANLNKHTAADKRILIIGAGIGSGCVLLQLLKAWGAVTTAVCDRRAQKLVAALGAEEVLISDWCDDYGTNGGQDANLCLAVAMADDLATRNPWDAIFICHAPRMMQKSILQKNLAPGGIIADLRPKPLYTDSIGTFFSLFYGSYLSVRRTFSWLRGVNTDADFLLPFQLDAEVLDKLSSHVESGDLQTVVDKVYPLKDFELALAHTCSMGAIGCTVVRIS